MGLAALCLTAALIQGLGFEYLGIECLAYVPAAAVFILAAVLQRLPDTQGLCWMSVLRLIRRRGGGCEALPNYFRSLDYLSVDPTFSFKKLARKFIRIWRM